MRKVGMKNSNHLNVKPIDTITIKKYTDTKKKNGPIKSSWTSKPRAQNTTYLERNTDNVSFEFKSIINTAINATT